MKKLFPLLLTLASCTAPTSKEIQDSTAVGDTVVTEPSIPDQQSIVERDIQPAGDTSQLAVRYEEVSQSYAAFESTYSVSISTSQYEASSDVTWYFDSSLSPRYFKMTWSAEGQEGSTELFIETDNVVCATEEENNFLETWCTITGGIRTRWREDGSTEAKELLSADYGADCNESFHRYFDILKSILEEGTVSEQDEDTYLVKIEKTVNYGEDFTESTEVTIPKKVFNAIKN